MVDEIWKVVKDYPDYEVSNKGRVRSYKCGYLHFLKPGKRLPGYLHVVLANKKGSFNKSVHILVLEAFIGLRPNNLVANHKDGIKTNNNFNNLEWITKSEDVKHARHLGLIPYIRIGEQTSQAKLKDGEVWLIKRLLWFEYTQRKVAKMFKVCGSTVGRINKEYVWSHIKFEPTDKDRETYRRQNLI